MQTNDIQIAKNNLSGHTICLCKDGDCVYSEKHGIAPMMDFIADGVNIHGFSVADLIVGKAAAMLFVKCGIAGVYAKTLSQSGKAVLERFGIPFEYETLTEKIINRAGTGVCPMEKAVYDCEEPDEAYILLLKQLKMLKTTK